jgi:hypothetical protein
MALSNITSLIAGSKKDLLFMAKVGQWDVVITYFLFLLDFVAFHSCELSLF